MKPAAVIIPTTGDLLLKKAVESVLEQTFKNLKIYLIIDGIEYSKSTNKTIKEYKKQIQIIELIDNVGKNGFYGHRIYAAFSHLVNQDYLFFLDQDNYYEKNHVESLVNLCEEKNYSWAYSLRNIINKKGEFICQDNCESLGIYESWMDKYYHIDTNCYCLKRETAVGVSATWHGGWGQDRVVYNNLKQYFPNYGCSGLYTSNYRLDGNSGSIGKDFFIEGNKFMQNKYSGNFPWSKNEN